jgi:hypothetical protein
MTIDCEHSWVRSFDGISYCEHCRIDKPVYDELTDIMYEIADPENAKLIAYIRKQERERCAKIADEAAQALRDSMKDSGVVIYDISGRQTAEDIATAIRDLK